MSTIASRSTTGCLACKTKRKKCDETKPSCLRCQKSRMECPGYTYIINPEKPTRKLRTLLAPRTLVGQSRELLGPDLGNLEDIGLPPQGPLLMSNGDLNEELGSSKVTNVGILSETIDMSNPWVFLSSFSGSLQHPSIDLGNLHGLSPAATSHFVSPPNSSNITSMTSGQASLFRAMFSLSQPADPPSAQPNQGLLPKSSAPAIVNYSTPIIEVLEDPKTPEDEDPEGVVRIICSMPVLDKTAEGNALPFVLQGYAKWIRRMAFEPLKMVWVARDFVFSHFIDGEESRRILSLLADIGSKIGSVEVAEGKFDSTVTMLQNAVRRRLVTATSCPKPNKPQLVKALDCALETIIINFFVSTINEAATLRQEAAAIFRQLCSEPAGTPINLPSLLLHPPICLRHYAHIDILFSITMDMPTLFRYDVTVPGGQLPTLYGSTPENLGESGLRWLHGIPDPLILLFAKMKATRDDKLVPSAEMILSLEHEIRELPPLSSSSSESFLVIVRFVVQECWRQVAYIYLYMALCGDQSDTTRVKGALGQFMKLLRRIKPGRLPDEFLIMNLILVAPAAQRKRDRDIIRQRLQGFYTHSRTFRTSHHTLCVIEDYWARADAEGRQVVWSDVAVSRIRILGI